MGKNARELLAAMSIKTKGNWTEILNLLENKIEVEDEYIEQLEKYKDQYQYITLLDDQYPQRLKMSMYPPIVLFYKGNINLINDDKIIAMIGSTNPTEYGIDNTKKLTEELIKQGMIICTNTKPGINNHVVDVVSKNHSKMILIGDVGINNITDKVTESGGLILTEYPLDTKEPNESKHYKPNTRIIAGLSKKIIITEATKDVDKDVMLTVAYGLSNGVDIYCVPERIGNNSLCNNLIQQGAFLVENYKDIIEEISKDQDEQ